MSKWSNPPEVRPGEIEEYNHPLPVEAEAPALGGDFIFIRTFHKEKDPAKLRQPGFLNEDILTGWKLIALGVPSVLLYGLAGYGLYRLIF